MAEGHAMIFSVLGPLAVQADGIAVNPGSARQRAVLSALLLTPGQPVTSEQLSEAVWPRNPPNDVMANLHSYVSNLRRLLEPNRPPRSRDTVLRREPNGYVLAVNSDCIDATLFERLLHDGRHLLQAGLHQRAERTLGSALALCRGTAYPEVSDYALGAQAAARFEELRLLALESLWEAKLSEARDFSVVAAELPALTLRFPTRERFSWLLMKALYRSGRRADAIDAYHRTRRALAEEYGVDPGAELQELFGSILRGDPVADCA
ncbi:BTAD domain-containing putative transcriptional regulator [Kitasatospora misakiensis]|uniref:BTAD domain-containing putative transcriptional regulator n=1 Tax=Kitasatospora misakiensis TaxID=67330 RepID=A0ABW0WX12_9ACTN